MACRPWCIDTAGSRKSPRIYKYLPCQKQEHTVTVSQTMATSHSLRFTPVVAAVSTSEFPLAETHLAELAHGTTTLLLPVHSNLVSKNSVKQTSELN